MYQDDEDFSRKSNTYRRNHVDAVKALYGDKPDVQFKPKNKRKVKRRIYPLGETYIQIKLVQWAKSEGLNLISIPNAGKRSYWTGQKEVAMGLTKGVSDLFLAHMSGRYGGFWIELKRPGEKPSVEQEAWLTKMAGQGYMAAWFDNFEVARSEILAYLNRKG